MVSLLFCPPAFPFFFFFSSSSFLSPSGFFPFPTQAARQIHKPPSTTITTFLPRSTNFLTNPSASAEHTDQPGSLCLTQSARLPIATSPAASRARDDASGSRATDHHAQTKQGLGPGAASDPSKPILRSIAHCTRCAPRIRTTNPRRGHQPDQPTDAVKLPVEAGVPVSSRLICYSVQPNLGSCLHRARDLRS